MAWFDFPDDKGDLYYVFFPITVTRNISQSPNTSSFLKHTIAIGPRTNVFQRDLTNLLTLDEVFLAVLSIIFLLAVDAAIATILLRTTGGNVSLSRFFINKSVELTRSFRFTHITKERDREHRPRLLLLSFAFIFFSLALALTIFVLTTRISTPVSNATKTLELVQPVNPDWNAVRNDSTRSINRPCTVMRLLRACQFKTTINTCVVSSMSPIEFDTFERAEGNVPMTITSDMHPYGAEHNVTIGDDSAYFSARAYVTFDDDRVRVLRQRTIFRSRAAQVHTFHKNLVGYLLSAYQRATNDDRITLDFMKDLEFTSETFEGPPYTITQVGDGSGFVRAQSTQHKTQLTALLPRGPAALRFAQSVIKASTAIGVTSADVTDLLEDEGESIAEAVVWRDPSRRLNWLSLLIMSLSALFILFALRLCLKPIATQEIADVLVARAADEAAERDAFRSKEDEPKSTKFVRVSSLSNEREYHYGAETLQNPELGREEYQENMQPGGRVPYL